MYSVATHKLSPLNLLFIWHFHCICLFLVFISQRRNNKWRLQLDGSTSIRTVDGVGLYAVLHFLLTFWQLDFNFRSGYSICLHYNIWAKMLPLKQVKIMSRPNSFYPCLVYTYNPWKSIINHTDAYEVSWCWCSHQVGIICINFCVILRFKFHPIQFATKLANGVSWEPLRMWYELWVSLSSFVTRVFF